MRFKKSTLSIASLILVMLAAVIVLGTSSAQTSASTAQVSQVVQEINHLGGLAQAVAGMGDYLVAGIDRRVVIFDQASANRLAPVGQSQPLAGQIDSLVVYDNAIYVGLKNDGLVVLDVSNVESPVIVWQHWYAAWDLLIDKDHLIVAGGWQGLHIYDLNDPHEPALVATQEMPGGMALALDVEGDVVFVVVQNYLALVNFSDKANPRIVGQYALGDSAHDVEVSGNTAFIGVNSMGLLALAVGNPANVHEIGRFSDIYYTSKLYLHGKYLIVSDTRILDVSDANNMREMAYNDDIYFLDITQFGEHLILTGGENGLLLLDTKALPKIKTQIVLRTKSYLEIAEGSDRLVAGTVDNGIQVIDTSNPYDPKPRGTLSFVNSVTDVAMSGRNALVTLESGLHIINTNDTYNPTQIGHVPIEFAQSVAVKDKLAYVAGSNEGLITVDISDPANPKKIHDLPMYSESLTIGDEHLYLLQRDPYRLHIVSLKDPRKPAIVSTFNEKLGSNKAVGNTLYAAAEDDILVFDTSNPAAPEHVGTFKAPGSFPSIIFANKERLYVDTYYAVDVYDIATAPYQPQKIHSIDTKGNILRLVETDEAIYTTAYSSGLSTRVWVDAESEIIAPLGGSFTTSDGKVTYHFGEGVLETYPPMTHIYLPEESLLQRPPQLLTGVFFSGVATNHAGHPLTPNKPYQMELLYSEDELGIVEEESLVLYRFDGSRWNVEQTAVIDHEENKVSAEPQKFGVWALTGEAAQVVKLPVVFFPRQQPDLKALGMEVTQVVQSMSNHVPLVSGRKTVVRVHVRADAREPVDKVAFMLEGTRDGSPLPGSPLRVDNWALFNKHDRANLADSFNITLPESWTRGRIHLQAHLNPDKRIVESNYGNNASSATVEFRDKPPLNVTLVPVAVNVTSDGGYCPAPKVDGTLASDVERLFPVNEFNVTVREPVTMSADNFSQMLSKVAGVKGSDGAPESTVYYGVVGFRDEVREIDCFDSFPAGVGYVGRRVGVGANSHSVMAHETGHNLGLKHAPCGDPDGVDWGFPYEEASIGHYGYDILDDIVWSPNSPDFAKDFMSYCGPVWISDYNYLKLFNEHKLMAVPGAGKAQPVLLIRASLNHELGSFDFAPVYRLITQPSSLPNKSDTWVELVTDSGDVIAAYPVEVDRAQEPGISLSDIVVTVPLVVDKDVTAVRLRQNGRLLAQQTLEASVPVGTVATMSRDSVSADLALNWTMNDQPVLVRFVADAGQVVTTYGIDLMGGSLTIPATVVPNGDGTFEIISANSLGGGRDLVWISEE